MSFGNQLCQKLTNTIRQVNIYPLTPQLFPFTFFNPFKHKLTEKIKKIELLKPYRNLPDTIPNRLLIENLEIACDLINQVRSVITKSSSHPDCNGKIDSEIISINDTITKIRAHECNTHEKKDAIQKNKIGNCLECIELAFCFMQHHPKKRRAECLVIEGSKEALHQSHVLLVIGRPLESNLSDPLTWQSSVICDPWEGAAYAANDATSRWAVHRCFSITYQAKGNKHFLGNIIEKYNPHYHKFKFDNRFIMKDTSLAPHEEKQKCKEARYSSKKTSFFRPIFLSPLQKAESTPRKRKIVL